MISFETVGAIWTGSDVQGAVTSHTNALFETSFCVAVVVPQRQQAFGDFSVRVITSSKPRQGEHPIQTSKAITYCIFAFNSFDSCIQPSCEETFSRRNF